MELNQYYALLKVTQTQLPHGRLDSLQSELDVLGAFSTHALFTAHLASWLSENGELRDPKIVLAANLIANVEWRDVGNALLQTLSPTEVIRALRYLKGNVENIKVRDGKQTKIEKVSMGLKRNVPKSTLTAVRAYLKWKDEDIDGVIRAGQGESLKSIYRSLRLRPEPNAEDALFSGAPTRGVAYWLRLLPTMEPDMQAETIMKHRLPYTLAVGAVKQMTASVVYALINSMTTGQLQHSLASLEKRGALSTPEHRALVEKKLSKNTKTVALRQNVAAAAITDVGIKEKLAEVEQKQISLRGSIDVPIALIVDKSGSQKQGIELSKELLPYLAGASKNGLTVLAFDDRVVKIELPKSVTPESVRTAFRGITGDGGTVFSNAVNFLNRSGFKAELLIVLSDEQTESRQMIENSFNVYKSNTGLLPSVLIARMPINGSVSRYEEIRKGAESAGLVVDAFDVEKSDTYAVGQILRLATGGGKIGIVQQILEFPLLKVQK